MHCDERQELIAEAVVVECAIGARNHAGFVDGVFEQVCECCRVLVLPCGPSCREGQRAAAIMAGAVSQSSVGCRLGAFACYQHAGVPLSVATCAYIIS